MKWCWVFFFQTIYIYAVINTSVVDYISNLQTCFKVPSICPNSDISYYLYTRSTQDSPQLLDPIDIDSIKNAKFTPGVPLKVLIHGYTGHKDYAPNPELRKAYFEHGEYNIITVDWGKLARYPCYIEATYNLQIAGICAANLLDMIFANNGQVTLENTHVIGFSLGAHVAGVLASSLTSGRLPRLTGLDAALPLLDKYFSNPSQIIDPSDAVYVDGYHTNEGQKGRISTYGTVDFYINNAAYQPGCNCNSSCSHYRAVEYFAESINSEVGFYAFPCYSWHYLKKGFCNVSNLDQLVLMGEHIPYNLSGVYYALTNYKPPYALPKTDFLDVKNMAKKLNVKCSLLQT